MKVLITGFEPFGGQNINPSLEIARVLAETGREPGQGWGVKTGILPVDTTAVAQCLDALMEKSRPDILIMLGQAGGRSGIQVERIAINVLDFAIADNSGRRPVDEPVVFGGPAAYLSTLPARAIVDALNGERIPAVLSNTAGTYLCNQAMYLALHRGVERFPNLKAGFIHVPFLPEQTCGQMAPAPSMSLNLMVQAVRMAITETIKSFQGGQY